MHAAASLSVLALSRNRLYPSQKAKTSSIASFDFLFHPDSLSMGATLTLTELSAANQRADRGGRGEIGTPGYPIVYLIECRVSTRVRSLALRLRTTRLEKWWFAVDYPLTRERVKN